MGPGEGKGGGGGGGGAEGRVLGREHILLFVSCEKSFRLIDSLLHPYKGSLRVGYVGVQLSQFFCCCFFCYCFFCLFVFKSVLVCDAY